MVSDIAVARRGPAAARMLGFESVGPDTNISHISITQPDASGRGETEDRDSRIKKRRPRGRAADCGRGTPKGATAAGSRPTPRARPLSQGPIRAAAPPFRRGAGAFLIGGGAPFKKAPAGGRNAGRGSPLCAGLRGGGPRRP